MMNGVGGKRTSRWFSDLSLDQINELGSGSSCIVAIYSHGRNEEEGTGWYRLGKTRPDSASKVVHEDLYRFR